MKTNDKTAAKCSWKNAILLGIAALALLASPGVALAADCLPVTNWTDGTGSWFTSGNWDNGVPNSGTGAVVNNGGTAQISGSTPLASACSLSLGPTSGHSGNASVSTSGSLTVTYGIVVGDQGTGSLSVTNQSSVTSATLSIASQTGSNGSAKVDGTGSSWTVSGGADVGPGGTGSLSVTNAGAVTSGAMSVGGTTGTTPRVGTLTVSDGGTVSATSVGVNGSGTLTGNGTVSVNSGSGTVTVYGTLAPSGTLSISGNLRFPVTNSNMNCTVSSTRVDNAQVSGTAQLNGKLSVTVSSAGDFTLLHTNGGFGITKFDSYSFTYIGCFSASVSYVNGTDVVLHVVSTCN